VANWKSLGRPGIANPKGFDPALAIGCNMDGRLEIFAQGADGVQFEGSIWHTWQTVAGDPESWTGVWVNRGRPPGVVSFRGLAVGSNLDGRLEVFATSIDGTIWHTWQTAPNGGWPPPGAWSVRGQMPGVKLNGVVVGRNADGRLEVFAFGDDHAVWHTWQTAPNNGWPPPNSWASRGRPPGVQLRGRLAVGSHLNGRLEIFAPGDDAAIWHTAQIAANDGWPAAGNWISAGKPPGLGVGDAAVARNKDGRLELIGVGGTQKAPLEISHTWQTAPNGGWVGLWASYGVPTGTGISLFGHAVTSNADGRLEVFAMDDGPGAVWHIWQVAANDGWRPPGDWVSLGNPSSSRMGAPVAFTTADGRIEIFSAARDGDVWHTWQTKPNNGWH
jgi:hypothetical protein